MEFSPDFQLRLLALLYIDRDTYLQVKDHIKLEYLSSIFFQWLFKLLETYFQLYKSLPTRTVVEQELQHDEDVILLEEEKHFIAEFFNLIENGFPETQYIKDNLKKFIKSKEISRVLNEYGDLAIKSGEFDNLAYHLRNAERNLTFNGDRPESLFSLDLLREITDREGAMKSGLGLIDNTASLMPKELSIFLGDTNVGKSFAMVHIGGHVLRQMRKVVHVTLEMSKARTMVRYLTNLLEPEDNLTYQNIVNCEPYQRVSAYIDKAKEQYGGSLCVEEYPADKCTIENLYRLMDRHDPDILIVDYVELLKPIVRRKDVRHESNELIRALHALAKESGKHVLTNTQGNRQSAHRRIVGKELVSEDYNKMRVPDLGIGIGQNKNDELKHEVVMHIARSRNTEKGLAERYFQDYSSMKFKLLRQEFLDDDH